MSNKIPTVSLDRCVYDKNRKRLKLSSAEIGMPSAFYVKSHATGRLIKFVCVGPDDELFDQDQWDGIQQIYRPENHLDTVDHMIISEFYE